MTEEARETTTRYASGETPQVGDAELRGGDSIDDWQEICRQHERIVAELRAENARLRAALIDLAGGVDSAKIRLRDFWNTSKQWDNWKPDMPYIVPPHIAALQDAIYREGGE